MRVLVTGSSGQIGTNLILKLRSLGQETFGVDWRPNSWVSSVTDVSNLDLATESLDGIITSFQPDMIVHLAAYAKVHELVVYPDRAFKNVQVAFSVLEACRKHNLPIIFASSREVYSNKDHPAYFTEESLVTVEAESPYAASKVAAEAFIHSYTQCYKIPHLIFRFSNVYGRYDNDLDRMTRVIPLFAKCISEETPIEVYGRDKLLDFTYVDDCIAGIIHGIHYLDTVNKNRQLKSGLIYNNAAALGTTINLAFGQGQTLLDLVNLLAMAVGKVPKAEYKEPLSGEVTRYVADISKAKTLLGYEPKVPLSAGLPLTVDWYRKVGFIK